MSLKKHFLYLIETRMGYYHGKICFNRDGLQITWPPPKKNMMTFRNGMLCNDTNILNL